MRHDPNFGRGWLRREFGAELRAFWRYLRHPRLSPRRSHPYDAPAWVADWLPACPWRLLLAWMVFLWGASLFIMGPVLLWALQMTGGEHALNSESAASLPLLEIIVVAPLIEEVLFRHGLRRPGQALWLVPLLGLWYWGQGWLGQVLGLDSVLASVLGVALLMTVVRWLLRRRAGCIRWGWRWRRLYIRNFGWVFHAVALIFAAVHLLNYENLDVLWLVPVLVWPQWLAGLVLGWLRVTRSLGSAIIFHAGFNAMPALLLWAALHVWPHLGS